MFLAIDIYFSLVGRISQPFLHEIPKFMRGSSCSLFCKFRSPVSGDFKHVFRLILLHYMYLVSESIDSRLRAYPLMNIP